MFEVPLLPQVLKLLPLYCWPHVTVNNMNNECKRKETHNQIRFSTDDQLEHTVYTSLAIPAD